MNPKVWFVSAMNAFAAGEVGVKPKILCWRTVLLEAWIEGFLMYELQIERKVSACLN